MNTTFADALSPLAKSMPRSVRNIEILRVSAQIVGEDFVVSEAMARTAVLKWASNRAGETLPKDAWELRDFETFAGGRNSSAIRIQNDSIDLWALIVDDPDKTVPGRNWVTEVVIGGEAKKRPHLSLRLLVSTNESDFRISPTVPGSVLQLIEAPGLIRGSRPLLAVPRLIQSEGAAEDLCDHLEDADRRLPVFVVVVPDNGTEPSIADKEVAKATAGLARVVRIPENLTRVLTNRFGRYRSVFNGAVRAYMAGFSVTDDPYRHRLFLGEAIRENEAANSCTSWLKAVAADASIASTRLGKEVLEFSSVRTASRRLKAQDQSNRAVPDAELLETANQLIDSLDKQIVEKSREIDGYVEISEAAEARALAAEQENRALLFKVRQLNEALTQSGQRSAAETPPPSNWHEFIEWIDNTYPDRLLLTPAARRMVKSPEFENVEQVARAITWLALEHSEIRINGGRSLRDFPIEAGIMNAPCGGDTYQTEWKGRTYQVDWHVKTGGNSRDPKRCLRIYYFWEPDTQQTVIDHLPSHRDTSAT